MKQNLRFGIIGCGVIAPSHIQSLKRIDGVEISWVCDLVRGKAEKCADAHGIARVTTQYPDVLADPGVDAVCVCTDHASHAPITVAAFDAGKHVLCEKALAASSHGMDAMFAAQARHPELVFGAVFQHRFDPEYRYVKELIDSGAFGRILTAGVHVRCLREDTYYQADQWRGTWAEEGGAVLINQAIHFIDLLLWFMGGATAVCGTHENLTHQHSMETEDTAAALLRFTPGALGTIEATCSSHLHWEPTILIHGTDGSIEMRNDAPCKLEFCDGRIALAAQERFAALAANQADSVGKDYYGKGHPAQVADFVEAIRNDRQPFVRAESARATVETVLSVYQSHKTGQWVPLKWGHLIRE